MIPSDGARPVVARIRCGSLVARVGTITALAIAALTGCGRRAGDACKPRESLCKDKSTALNCRNEKLVEVACRGPSACSKYEDHANCDDSVASAGETCMGATEDAYACTPDKKQALICKNGVFEPYLECRGKSGCALLGLKLSCDTSIAAKGDVCKTQGSSACSVDGKELLVCRDGKFAHHRHCRGPSACFMKDEVPSCDETLSLEGDECKMAGYVVCSLDGKSELLCEGGRFRKSRACRSACVVIDGGRGGIDCR